MRAQKAKRNRAVFAALVLMTACTLLLALVGERSNLKNPSGSSLGSPRLVSIQEVPDYGEICAPEPQSRSASMIAALEEKNLLTAFRETAVHAASPETGDTTEVTRPPSGQSRTHIRFTARSPSIRCVMKSFFRTQICSASRYSTGWTTPLRMLNRLSRSA